MQNCHVYWKATATHCNTRQHSSTLCNALPNTATERPREQKEHKASPNPLKHTAPNCNTLQHAATRCNKLQHAATHYIRETWSMRTTRGLPRVAAATNCIALQHATKHCNTLQQRDLEYENKKRPPACSCFQKLKYEVGTACLKDSLILDC